MLIYLELHTGLYTQIFKKFTRGPGSEQLLLHGKWKI
jgi:hypothetical protein